MLTTSILSALVLTLCVGLNKAFIVITRGDCPNIPTKSDFVLNNYLGQWYSYEQFDAPFQYNSVCVKADYGLLRDGSINVTNTAFTEVRIGSTVLSRSATSVNGKAIVVDPTVPAALQVEFSGQPDVGDGANYFVLDTDYTTYSLVYSCQPFIPGFLKTEIAWILTRTAAVPPANINDLYDLLTGYGVDVGNFKIVRHTECVEKPFNFLNFFGRR